MRFYDNERKEHDTRIGAICGSISNVVGGFIKDKIPGIDIFDNMNTDIIDGDCRDIEDDLDDTFFDTETKEEPPTVGEVVETYGTRFRLDNVNNVIEVVNSITNDVVDKIIVTEALTEGFITEDLKKYTASIKTKESIDSLKECLDQVSMYNA